MRTWLKRQRELVGLTQKEIAERVHISESYYNLIENAKRTPPVTIAKALGKELEFCWTEFYGED